MKRTILALLLTLAAPQAIADQFTCRVVGASDGDTVTCQASASCRVKVKLAEFDALKSKHPDSSRATQAIDTLAYGNLVGLHVRDTDHHDPHPGAGRGGQ